MKCYYVANMYEYVIAYVYAENVNQAKKMGFKFDPNPAAELTQMRAVRCKGLDKSANVFELVECDGCLVVDLDAESINNENQLIKLKYAHKDDGNCYFYKDKLKGDEYE